MSERKWNAHQQAAIDARDGSIVVSAAAGSGKTSVLSERVLSLIEEGADIERMLIVTFTNLAAAEMRERIYLRLLDASRDKASPSLAAQAEKCAFADISTIHAFCNRVIRDNFEYAGVSPTFAVGSTPETGMLRQRALDAAIETAAQRPGMHAFWTRHAPRGDMRVVKNVVSTIYSRVISMKEPQAWLDEATAHYNTDDFVSVLFDAYKQMAQRAANEAAGYLRQRSDIWALCGIEDLAAKSENERIAMLERARAMTMADTALPDSVLIQAPGVKGAPNRESRTLTGRANKCLAELKEYAAGFEEKVHSELAGEAADGRIFIELTRDYMARYAKAKRDRNVLDHDDALHFARRALAEPHIAQRYQNRYTHVFVDEYQDINDVQHDIIARTLRGGNDFFVGDVKQCIYMFRESNPALLIRRCRELDSDGLIEMNTNYRSAPEVIEWINGMMHHMMNEQAGGVKYTGGQCLCAGTDGQGDVRVVLADSSNTDALEAEGAVIAATIKQLAAQGVKYRDMAVLRPEVAGTGRQIADALASAGIPVVCGYENTDHRFDEVRVFVNLLALIDGSGDDIALLSVMRYPYFGFTETEMARIRIWANAAFTKEDDTSFAHALRMYEEDDALGIKVKQFWQRIAYYRALADSLPMPDFLMQLRREAMFETYALTAPGGCSRDAAVRTFIREASAMDAVRISDVLRLAERILACGDSSRSPEQQDAVYITTIHKSKGLEFGAVILSGMHKQINMGDAAGSVLVGRDLGIALDLIDSDSRIRRTTLHKKAVAQNMRREKLSEVVRLLYVGMTRAKQRLIICGAAASVRERWLEEKTDGWQFGAVTYLDLVMPALAMACRDMGVDIAEKMCFKAPEMYGALAHNKETRLNDMLSEAETMQPAKLFETYAHADKLSIPSKVSVSALKRMNEPEIIRPAMMPSGNEDISAAERGTLMHKVLQMIGFDEKNENEVAAAIREIAQKGVIEQGMDVHVDIAGIAWLLQSDIAARARGAKRCLTEAPFCLQMTADETGLRQADETVIVQGVIDLCFVENGEWVVVDYKTDNVKKADAQQAAEKYRVQLSMYARALTDITQIPVKQKVIYYLTPGEAVVLT